PPDLHEEMMQSPDKMVVKTSRSILNIILWSFQLLPILAISTDISAILLISPVGPVNLFQGDGPENMIILNIMPSFRIVRPHPLYQFDSTYQIKPSVPFSNQFPSSFI